MPTVGQFLDNLLYKNTPVQTFEKQVNPGVFNFINPSARPKMKEKEYIQAYTGWVYACTDKIAARLADIELQLQKKDGKGWKTIEDHPALDLLHKVNDFDSYTDLLYSTAAFLELTGNAFWNVVNNAGGKPGEIWYLDPNRVTIAKSKTEFIAGYVYTNEANIEIPFDADEIIHFKRFNPKDRYRGMGTVEAAALPIDIYNFAGEWQRNFFGNSAIPSGILYTEQTMTQEQYDRIKNQWDSRFKGVGNAHKLGIMEGGMKYQGLTPNSREMQFSESKKDIRDEVLGIFGVPKPILGILEDINLASADAADQLFSKNTIKPKMTTFVETLNEYYLMKFKLDRKTYRFNFGNPVPENVESLRADRDSGVKNGYLTINEARSQIGKEPIEGGDNLFIPTTSQSLTNALLAKTTEPTPAPVDPADEGKSVKKNFKLIPIVKEAQLKHQEYKQEQIDILHKVYMDLNKKLEDELVTKLKNKKAVPTAITKDNQANELVRFLFSDYADWVGLVYNATETGLKRILEQSGKDTMTDLQVDVDFDLQNPRALDWLNEHALEDSNSYTGTWKDTLSLRIQEGVENGDSNDKIADSLGDQFLQDSDMRSMRIARTETINGYSQGNLEGYRQSGVVSGKYWIFDGGECTSGECTDNEAAGTIPLDDDFPSGDDAPTAHPNCECDLGGATDESL